MVQIINLLILLGFAIAVYFIPTFTAGNRRHKNKTGVFFLNLFLGWTFVGWVGALVWSVWE